jgi:hypothetical protein
VTDGKKNGRILFDMPKSTAGCSASGRRRRRRRRIIIHLHALDAHRPEERALSPTEQKVGWSPVLIWTFQKRNLAPAGRLVTKLTKLSQLP